MSSSAVPPASLHQVALITGATSGVGRRLAREFARHSGMAKIDEKLSSPTDRSERKRERGDPERDAEVARHAWPVTPDGPRASHSFSPG